jgi:hypothetical protein
MKEINVLKAFLLTLADHTQRAFAVGVHKVEDEIADHWYVKAHSEPVVSVGTVSLVANPPVDPVDPPVVLVVPVPEAVEAAPVQDVATDGSVMVAHLEAAPEPEPKKKNGK